MNTKLTSRDNPKRARVVCLPWYPGNPYQQQLAADLERKGVDVSLLESRAFFKPSMIVGRRPAVLHLHWVQPYVIARNIVKSWIKFIGFVTQLALIKLRGVTIVWTAHELRDHEQQNPVLDRMVTRFVARLADGVIAHCEAARRAVISELGVKRPQRVFVVPLGNYFCYKNEIDRSQARASLDIPDGRVVFLFIGMIKPYKGVLELIDAFSRIDAGDAHLVIAGKPNDEELGAAIRSKIGGRADIRFDPGFMPEDKIQVYLNACDVTVFPYRDIFSSSSVLLSMSFGRPCIAPRIGCIPEDADESVNILYDPPADPGLYEAMRRALEARDALAAMGERNLELAKQASWDRIAGKTLDVYRSCGARTLPAAGGPARRGGP